MHSYALSHVSDAMLLRDLTALVVQDRQTTALLLAHIAEVDARKLYVPAGYPSMHAYCVGELGFSEDAALRRIQAAKAGRQFPTLLVAIAQGRLHLTGVCVLAPYLTEANAAELLEEASGRRKWEIEGMLARRFTPVRELPATIRPLADVPLLLTQHAPAHVVNEGTSDADGASPKEHAPSQAEHPSAERFLLQVAVGASTREKLRHAQALLSHAVPSGDVAEVLERALDALIDVLEKRKFGAGKRGAGRRAGGDGGARASHSHYVPAHVRSAVWQRDGGQCTFMGENGRRCGARRFLEFDHVDPVARGGEATVDRMRLRCRAHNQYEAERTFGREFMRVKRQEARQHQDVLAGLRSLGFRADEARRAVEHTAPLEGAALGERLRAAIQFLGQRKAQGLRAPASG